MQGLGGALEKQHDKEAGSTWAGVIGDSGTTRLRKPLQGLGKPEEYHGISWILGWLFVPSTPEG